jgi:two-component system CheB/CheR fusion protein
MFTKAVADLRLNHRNAASQLPLSPADHAMCVREAAIDTSPVAQAIVDMNGTLIIANERLRALFGIKAQDLGKPFQDLEFSYRPVELRSVIEQAYTERTMIEVGDFEHQMPNGTVRTLAVDVVPLHSKEGDLLGAHLLFQDRTKALKLEDDLRRINQELEAASEELQSTNEELETTNEELQSANEELETMNEELQSSNEELNALNAEVRHRSKESARLNILLQAILKSLPVGLLVVNKDMEIIMWNKHCEELWGLRTAEVMGCSLSSMDIGLRVDRLRKPIRDCLTNEGISIRLTVDAINRLGRSIQCRVTCTSFVGPSGEQVGVALILEDAACWPSDSDQEEATG